MEENLLAAEHDIERLGEAGARGASAIALRSQVIGQVLLILPCVAGEDGAHTFDFALKRRVIWRRRGRAQASLVEGSGRARVARGSEFVTATDERERVGGRIWGGGAHARV